MEAENLFLSMDDRLKLFVRVWTEVHNPRGILQIAHGMAEHSARYDDFAMACNKQGFIVVANDHRGHGLTGEKQGVMGYFSEQDGFERVVDDLHSVHTWINKKYSTLPHFLLGHSMGSFLTRRYLQKYGESIAGAILMGSGSNPRLALKIGGFIASLQKKNNPQKPSKLLDKMSFGSYNRGIKNAKTKFDWLSRDANTVQKYLDDPHCGFVCSSGFFFDLFTGLKLIHDPILIENIPKNLPILVVSGDADPVGAYGKGIAEFVGQLKKYGVINITTKLYPEARHELLNEINKTEVTCDLLNWLQEQLKEEHLPTSLI